MRNETDNMKIAIQHDDGTEIASMTLKGELGIEHGSTPRSYRLTYATTFILCRMLVDAGLKPAEEAKPVSSKGPPKIVPFKA